MRDVSFSARAGEFVTIVGPSGCGKSTLLYMLAGFIQADAGRIIVNGAPVAGPGLDRGIVFQEYALFPWLTVAQNIAYGLGARKSPAAAREAVVRQLVRTIGLEGFENRYPAELSGGMKQRVAIARTLAYEPDILLLDEPLGALDALTREAMQDELLRLWKATGKTIVMVTHDVDEAVYLSGRVLVMSRRPGAIVEAFDVTLDRSVPRERLVTSAEYGDLRNRIWLSVRRQAQEASA
ncbi:MAG: ABC transporter ATP-binding protein [Lautropia sp.]